MSRLGRFSANRIPNRKKKPARKLAIALFCLFMLPVAQAQNEVPIHPVDGEFSLVNDLQLSLLLLKLANAIFIFMLIAGLRFLYALFCPRLPKQFWFFLLVATALNAWDLVQPYNDNMLRTVFVIIALLEMLRVTMVAIRRKQDGAWIIGAGFIFFALVMSWATFYDMLASMNILPNFEENLGIIIICQQKNYRSCDQPEKFYKIG